MDRLRKAVLRHITGKLHGLSSTTSTTVPHNLSSTDSSPVSTNGRRSSTVNWPQGVQWFMAAKAIRAVMPSCATATTAMDCSTSTGAGPVLTMAILHLPCSIPTTTPVRAVAAAASAIASTRMPPSTSTRRWSRSPSGTAKAWAASTNTYLANIKITK